MTFRKFLLVLVIVRQDSGVIEQCLRLIILDSPSRLNQTYKMINLDVFDI